MEDNINKLEKANEYLDKFENKISTLNDGISKTKNAIKNKALTNAEKNELQNKIKELNAQKDSVNNEFRDAVKVIKKLEKKELEESEESERSEKSEEFMKGFYDYSSKKNMILMVLIEMVLIEMVLTEMVLTEMVLIEVVLIEMVLIKIALM